MGIASRIYVRGSIQEAAMRCREHPSIATAVVAAWCASNTAGLAKALYYGCAAHRDENAGFLYTAAIEWRHAAEVFDPNTLPAEYCWRQWERIMQLPRRLADPISDCRNVFSDEAGFQEPTRGPDWHL